MATAGESSDVDDDEEKVLEKHIIEVQSAKGELLEELERLSQREREYDERLHRLAAEKHQQTVRRLIELELELKHVKSEKDNVSHKVETLKKSLDEHSKVHREQIAKLDSWVTSAEQQLQLAKVSAQRDSITIRELQKQLRRTTEQLGRTKEDLTETRQRLSEVQKRLTVSEQVTAATQQRVVQQDDEYSQELQLELISDLHPTPHTAGLEALRSQYPELTTLLDAHILAVSMYQRNALTLKELQSIQSLRDRPVEAAEMLLNIIMEQPDAVYLCFLDVLKHADTDTGQQHIYRTLVQDGYKDYDDLLSHTSVIREHYVFLLETLDVKFSGLVGQLYSDQVLSAVERDDISAEQTSFRANEKLLAVLSHKSPQQFQLFLDALDNCGQSHVRNVITNQPADRETYVPVIEAVQVQVSIAATQTVEDFTTKERSYHASVIEMIYQFLSHTIDMKSKKLVDKLVTNDVLTGDERKKIAEHKKVGDTANSLLLMLKGKSGEKFESFLTTLGETGQQSVAEVVWTTLGSIRLTGQNPLQHPYVGQILHMLPEGRPVWGVTSLREEVFLLRDKERDQVEVYDVISYRLLRCLTVPKADDFIDMTSCEHHYCLYIANRNVSCIHRLDTLGTRSATQWPVNDRPSCLSVNKAHNVLVTCAATRKIKEFSTHGDLLRELTLPGGVVNPWHAIQLTNGQFVVCHGVLNDPVRLRRVSVISYDGSQTICSYGGQPGTDSGQAWRPFHLTVDDNEFVFVAHDYNRRVELLTPTLKYVRHIVSSDKLKLNPARLCLDVQRRRLYVAANDYTRRAAGHVVVFSV